MARTSEADQRRADVLRRRARGESVAAIAAALGLHPSRVYQILDRARAFASPNAPPAPETPFKPGAALRAEIDAALRERPFAPPYRPRRGDY